MAGINTSGVPSVEDYVLGRGKLFLAELDDAGLPKDFKAIGNVPELSLTLDVEKYEHFSSQEGLKQLDLSVVLQLAASMSFTFENVNDFGNLKYFFSGDTVSYVNPAVAGFTGVTQVKDGDLKVNTWVALKDASNNPLFQIDKANLTIDTTEAVPVELVEGTDYTVDEFGGKIFINDTVAVQTAIGTGDGLTADYAADANAADVDQITALTRTAVTLAVRFEQENAANAEKVIYSFHKVTLSADGDYNLISDEAAAAPLTGDIEKSDAFENTFDVFAPQARGGA
jgi:hypothetical protein